MDNTNNPVCFTFEMWVPEIRGNVTIHVRESDVVEYAGRSYASLDKEDKEAVHLYFKYPRR